MPIYRQRKNGKPYGSFQIDRLLKGTRLKLNTGTTVLRIAREMDSVIDDLKNMGLDVKLQQLLAKKVTIRELYAQKLSGKLFNPTEDPAFSAELKPVLDEWVRTYPRWTDATRANNRHLLNSLWKRLPAEQQEPLVRDIPKVLRFYSEFAEREEKPRVYNLTRAILTRFVTHRFGKLPSLYREIQDVGNLPNTLKDPLKAKTPAQIEKLCRALKNPDKYAGMVWTMCASGVGWDEYGKMTPRTERKNPCLEIRGTKMDRADGRRRRDVPLVLLPSERIGSNEQFVRVLDEASRKAKIGRVRPYTFRKCFSVWARESGIPEWRVQMYMGHAPKTMTNRYQHTELYTWLREDGQKLRRFIEEERVKIGPRPVSSEPLAQHQPFSVTVPDRPRQLASELEPD